MKQQRYDIGHLLRGIAAMTFTALLFALVWATPEQRDVEPEAECVPDDTVECVAVLADRR